MKVPIYSRLKARVVSTVKPNLNMANRQALTSVLCLTLCHFVLVFFSPFSIAITSLGEEKANLGAFRTFVRFVLVWILSVSSSSWCLGRAAVCDCGTPWTFLLPFFAHYRAVFFFFFTCSSSCYVWKILSGIMIDLLKGRGGVGRDGFLA